MQPRGPEDKYIEANGLRLHYLDWGGGTQGSLLLLHGLTGTAHDWDDMAPELTRYFRVLALDLRGHGDSQWSREGYWPQDYAADLRAFIDRLGLAPLDLLGHSLGSWVSMAYAGDNWRSLKHLLLSDFGPETGRAAAKGIKDMVSSPPLGFRNREEAFQWLKKSYSPPRPTAIVRRKADHNLRENWAGKFVWRHDPEVTWVTSSAGLKVVPYMWGQFGKIGCPILVMRGESSTLLTPEIQAKMLEANLRASAATIPGVGHYLYDNPPGMLEAVLGFLKPTGYKPAGYKR